MKGPGGGFEVRRQPIYPEEPRGGCRRIVPTDGKRTDTAIAPRKDRVSMLASARLTSRQLIATETVDNQQVPRV